MINYKGVKYGEVGLEGVIAYKHEYHMGTLGFHDIRCSCNSRGRLLNTMGCKGRDPAYTFKLYNIRRSSQLLSQVKDAGRTGEIGN